ncbi:DUF1800 family protein [Massilia sp. CF038]|uniref:DUF1800 domain-containing protein n=1 Tax=Massilia sp. CF038 TaxID=1881045 RepID=UPI00091FA0BD|nr:DUF1800 domain-containing protein [Massilia sp. CF038]SHG35016.1 Uncharacterized conserved protein, DUF1800 family [Massilia sp. CF038]
MPDSHESCLESIELDVMDTVGADKPALQVPALALLSGVALSACGGSGGSDGSPILAPDKSVPTVPPTAPEASRFLAQSSMGTTREELIRVQTVGYRAWLEEQFKMAPSATRWDWLIAGGHGALDKKNSESGADACLWVKMITAPDTLRQRVTFALSEIIVTSISAFTSGWNAFTGAAFMDMLEANAFGNYRTLLQDVSTSPAMGEYLTFRNNAKFNPKTGALPDENYAREIMQLFTIGLLQLNLDGTPKTANGVALETYTLDDITGLAKVFTGWNYDTTNTTMDVPDFKRRPMTQTAARHETAAKTFLGTTIPAGTDGVVSLKMALDAIFAHPNVAPFISRQLIQRLVCSNPSPAYIARVATAFNNDGNGVKGDMKAVIRAILLDEEARGAAGLTAPSFGKLREPILRFTAWARAFKASSPGNLWAIGNTSDPASRLGQSPMRSGSVFNFFRPGYVPPNTEIGRANMVAPEFQITNESTVVGYINYMQNIISRGTGDVKADYTPLLPMADSAQVLLDELNLVLVAGQLSQATISIIGNAVDSMPKGTDPARLNRIYAALVMVMAAPEFIVQK